MRRHPNIFALGAIMAMSAAGGIVAVDVSEEEREAKRKEPPREPLTFTPPPSVTAHDHERIRRAEVKHARKAASLARLAAASADGPFEAARGDSGRNNRVSETHQERA